MDADITKLTASLQEFHDNKAALVEAGTQGSLDHWKIPKLEMMLSIAPTISNMGTLGQWSANVTEHAHIDVIKDPAQSGNNQNFDAQICRYLNHQEKCRLFAHATTIHDLDLAEDLDDADFSEEEEDRSKSRKVTDYFERTRALMDGKFPTAPRPYRTFALDTVAFHLASRPTMTNTTVDRTAELYELPDFRPAIADYLVRHLPDFTQTIRGRRQSGADYRFGVRCGSNFVPATTQRS